MEFTKKFRFDKIYKYFVTRNEYYAVAHNPQYIIVPKFVYLNKLFIEIYKIRIFRTF